MNYYKLSLQNKKLNEICRPNTIYLLHLNFLNHFRSLDFTVSIYRLSIWREIHTWIKSQKSVKFKILLYLIQCVYPCLSMNRYRSRFRMLEQWWKDELFLATRLNYSNPHRRHNRRTNNSTRRHQLPAISNHRHRHPMATRSRRKGYNTWILTQTSNQIRIRTESMDTHCL